MAVIPKNFGEGGAYFTHGGGSPSLGAILRDLVTDLHTLNNTAVGITSPISAPALAAFSNPPTVGEMALLVTLVNQLRAHLIAGGAAGSGAALLSSLPA